MNTYEFLKYRSQNEPVLAKCLYDQIIKDGMDGSVADDIAARSCYANRLIENAGFPENVTISLHSDYRTDKRSGTPIIYSAPFNLHSGESRILATKVHDCMQKYLDSDNTHSWNVLNILQSDEKYGEVDYINGPAILVELGNSENAVDFAQLNSDNFRGMALESIRAAVDEYFGGPVCEISSSSPTPSPTDTSMSSLTPTISPTSTTTNTLTSTTDPYWSFFLSEPYQFTIISTPGQQYKNYVLQFIQPQAKFAGVFACVDYWKPQFFDPSLYSPPYPQPLNSGSSAWGGAPGWFCQNSLVDLTACAAASYKLGGQTYKKIDHPAGNWNRDGWPGQLVSSGFGIESTPCCSWPRVTAHWTVYYIWKTF